MQNSRTPHAITKTTNRSTKKPVAPAAPSRSTKDKPSDARQQTRRQQSPEPTHALDSIDLSLIEELQSNARTSFAELARRVHLSTPAVIDRIHRLEQTGVILRYRAEIDPAALGLPVRAFVKVTVAGDRLGSFARVARDIPEILECHRVTGNESFIVQVAVRDMNHLEAVIDSLMPYVATNTSMVLNSPVASGRIALHTGISPAKNPRIQNR